MTILSYIVCLQEDEGLGVGEQGVCDDDLPQDGEDSVQSQGHEQVDVQFDAEL